MLKSASRTIAAIVTAAVLAGAISVLSGANDKVSASAPLNSGKGDRLDVRSVGPACSEQAWPYYEANCVKDRRHTMSPAKATRIITADRVTGLSAVKR